MAVIILAIILFLVIYVLWYVLKEKKSINKHKKNQQYNERFQNGNTETENKK